MPWGRGRYHCEQRCLPAVRAAHLGVIYSPCLDRSLTMPAFTSHIFVCCNQREPNHRRGCCDPDGSEVLRDAFKTEVAKRKLGPLVRANKAGCLEQCEVGPTVVI